MTLLMVFIVAAFSLALGVGITVQLFMTAVFNRCEGTLKDTPPVLVLLVGLLAVCLPVLAGLLAIRSGQSLPVSQIETWGPVALQGYVGLLAGLTTLAYVRRGAARMAPLFARQLHEPQQVKAQAEALGESKKRFGDGGEQGHRREAAEFIELTYNTKGELIDCEILAGRFEGEDVDDLSIFELLALWFEIFEQDLDSARKLEKYLDFAMPDWRAFFLKMAKAAHGLEKAKLNKAGPRAQDEKTQTAAKSRAMTHEEALQILGLSEGASSKRIQQAYREIMKAVHPDQGGSSYLAAKVNEAKDFLLNEKATSSQ